MSDTDNTPPAEPRRRLTTDNDRLIVAVAAKCRGIIRAEDVSGVVPDLVSGRVRFSLTYAADAAEVVEAAFDGYPNLTVDVGDYESAAQLVRSIMIAAKRNAVPKSMEEAAAVAWRREQIRNQRIAEQGASPGVLSRRAAQLEAERREWQTRLERVAAAQRIGRQPAETNGDGDGEESDEV